ncbi:hypothetical protein B0H34DRAFT_670973 [Crassisporium funariophilum]|nr:hypothetical protein B0H34DRAFT_670973 [Crassisporium funariophilum]
MPVPVPRQNKSQAHPVLKHTNRAWSLTYPTQNLPGTLPAPPPSGIREEIYNTLPSWRRDERRTSWEENFLAPRQTFGQDFYKGLTAADNASVIKEAHAQACIPPMYNPLDFGRGEAAVHGVDLQRNMPFEGDDVTGSGHTSRDQTCLDNKPQWSFNLLIEHDGVDQMELDRPDTSPAGHSKDSGTFHHRLYQQGDFTPIFDNQSPGSESGPENSSSPLEPVTPFGDFVDRAVAAAQYPAYGTTVINNGVQPDYYEEKQAGFYAPPVFPTIAEQPNQEPVADTVAPSVNVSYKKLTEPLSEWTANYVWKVCTSGLNLPPAFAQPSGSSGHFSAAPPSSLAPSIHSLLLSTLLQPSAVFLALWYIVRLPASFGAVSLAAELVKEKAFRTALFGETYNGFEREAFESNAPFRLVVLGCILANKWLDDHTFSNKTWHSITNIPVQTLNKLESLALDIFSYDLNISAQQWSQWLAHVMSYHLSLSSPIHPQPISRPSSNPHSIVRKAIEEIMKAPVACKCASDVPQPVFLGLEERLREKLEKLEAMDMDVLEIDLDEDGPLREEYLPKRRVNNLGSQSSQRDNMGAIQGNAVTHQKWTASEIPQVKQLPPPAKWSPAGDEPILRDRNRVSGQYVAVQAPTLTTSYSACQPPDVSYNQNWNPAVGYMPMKSQPGYMYDISSVIPVNQQSYNPFGHIASVALSHSRSQSLSYDQDNLLSRNHMRSYSQSRFDYRCGALRMAAGEHVHTNESESRWMGAAAHYPYAGSAFIHIPAIGMQSAW